MPPKEHIARPQEDESRRVFPRISPTEDPLDKLTVKQLSDLPESVHDLTEKDDYRETDVPLYAAIKAEQRLEDRAPTTADDELTLEELTRINDNIDAFLQIHNIDLDEARHDPKFVHSLANMGLAQMERVVLMGKILDTMPNLLTDDATVQSHRFESADDHVFRLCINQLRAFRQLPTSGVSLAENEAYDPAWRRKIALMADKILKELLLADKQEGEEKTPDPEIEAAARKLLEIPQSNVEAAFIQLLAQGNIEHIDWRLLPKEVTGKPGRDRKELLPEEVTTRVFSPERAQNFMDFYDAFGGKIVTTEFDSESTKYPYYGVIFEVEGSKQTSEGTRIPTTFEVAYLERTAENMRFRRSKNPNPQPGEPLYKVLLERGSLEPTTEGHDGTYILVAEKPGEWKGTFAKDVSRAEAKMRRARMVPHRGEDRGQWMDRVLAVIQEELDKAENE